MDEVITAADVTSSSSPPSSPAALLPPNLPLLSAFLAFAIAQFLKVFTTWEMETLGLIIRDMLCCAAFPMVYTEKKWDSKRMIGSGGMPSSHSATVMALAVAIGLQEGTGGPTFAIAIVLACVVMYDASGVRLHAGRQAEKGGVGICKSVQPAKNDKAYLHIRFSSFSLKAVTEITDLLNQIVCEFPPEHPLSNSRPLRDSLGHTPLQCSCRSHVGMPSSISNEELQLGGWRTMQYH
ncbi:unnamed protein product [Camellia sinensis]